MNQPRLILAGGSGFLGQALARHFQALGWEVAVLTRTPQASHATREVRWDAETLGEWTRELEGAAAVVNLTGRTVDCRYNEANRRAILNSRVNSTRVLGEAIARCQNPPPVWLNASTATIYKHTYGPAWNEAGEIGATPEAKDEFSVQVARAWEEVFAAAQTPRTRKVAIRSAMVFGNGSNSVFPVLRRMTRLGLGGRMASGRQFVSWIHERDFCHAIEWIIAHDDFSGPVNLAAPNPLTNAEMMRLFRERYKMPFGLPAPEWLLEMGAFFLRTETELVIKSRRVVPGRLLANGFQFQFPMLREVLADLDRAPASTAAVHARHAFFVMP